MLKQRNICIYSLLLVFSTMFMKTANGRQNEYFFDDTLHPERKSLTFFNYGWDNKLYVIHGNRIFVVDEQGKRHIIIKLDLSIDGKPTYDVKSNLLCVADHDAGKIIIVNLSTKKIFDVFELGYPIDKVRFLYHSGNPRLYVLIRDDNDGQKLQIYAPYDGGSVSHLS